MAVPSLEDLGFGNLRLGAVKEEEEEEEIGPKLDPVAAGYRDYVILCGDCGRYKDPGLCSLVEGAVSKDGTCPHAIEKEEEYGMDEEAAEGEGSRRGTTQPAGGLGGIKSPSGSVGRD